VSEPPLHSANDQVHAPAAAPGTDSAFEVCCNGQLDVKEYLMFLAFGGVSKFGPSAPLRFLCVFLRVFCLIAMFSAWPAAAQETLAPAPQATGQSTSEPSEAPSPIDPALDPEEDREIAQRLGTIYNTVDGLAPVRVRVKAGVVVLSGEVSTQALREQAARLARNVQGVVEVENRIAVAQDLEGRLTPALERLQSAWYGFVRLLPVLLVSVAIMALAIVLSGWLARKDSLYRRVTTNDFLAGLLAQAVHGIVLVGGAALALLLLDAGGLVKTLLGAAGIAGLALGFALRDTVENYIASILLSLRRPFNPEDYIKIENYEGIVARLTPRATVLLTLDGNQVRIPNATVFKGLIVNFTAQPRRRFTFQLDIAPDEDLGRAQRAAIEALATVDGVLSSPPPSALYESVESSALKLTVAGWMDQSSHDFLRVRSEAIRMVITRLGESRAKGPEPADRLHAVPEPERIEAPSRTPTTATEGMDTARDASLNRVVKQERAARPDLLDQAGRQE
jgi:small-conductance mechanosensitive channel